MRLYLLECKKIMTSRFHLILLLLFIYHCIVVLHFPSRVFPPLLPFADYLAIRAFCFVGNGLHYLFYHFIASFQVPIGIRNIHTFCIAMQNKTAK